MKMDLPSNQKSRRSFFQKCFGCIASCTFSGIFAEKLLANNKVIVADDHKFLKNSNMSFERVFAFAYKRWYIPAMKNLQESIGKEKFIELLKESSIKSQMESQYWDQNFPDRTFSAWVKHVKATIQKEQNNISPEITKENEHEIELTIKECLWAKTFNEADAGDIGYAGVCYQDVGMIKKFNPEIKFSRDKTMMQGHDYCHMTWSNKT